MSGRPATTRADTALPQAVLGLGADADCGPIDQRLAAQGHVRTIYDCVLPAYPEEGCGFVFEHSDGQLFVLPTANRATRLHELDPVSYPRDGRRYFEPDMKPWLRALRSGLTPRVIFHSHPDTDAYFSETDRSSAVIDEGDGRLLERNPGVVHLVISVRGPAPTAQVARLYAFSCSQNDFVHAATYDARGLLFREDAE